MEEKSLVHELLHLGAFLLVAAAVALAGWNEPLRYLFMSSTDISAEEQALYPQEDTGKRVVWRPNGTALDRAPYRTDNSGLEYTGNIDGREMGTRSETESRKGIHNKKR